MKKLTYILMSAVLLCGCVIKFARRKKAGKASGKSADEKEKDKE